MYPNEPEVTIRNGSAVVDTRRLSVNPHPFHGLSSISQDIAMSAHLLPDTELMRIAGCLRTLADEVLAVIDRRHGARPAPRLVVDNTRR
jgi:hypothetical protein